MLSSDTPATATVAGNIVTAVAAGSATITAKVNGLSGTAKITVTAATIQIDRRDASHRDHRNRGHHRFRHHRHTERRHPSEHHHHGRLELIEHGGRLDRRFGPSARRGRWRHHDSRHVRGPRGHRPASRYRSHPRLDRVDSHFSRFWHGHHLPLHRHRHLLRRFDRQRDRHRDVVVERYRHADDHLGRRWPPRSPLGRASSPPAWVRSAATPRSP